MMDSHAADIDLARACASGDTTAIARFERTIIPDIRGAIVKLASDHVDEILQRTREKLLVGTPRIAEYRGRGPLAAWVQAIAIREALMLLRSSRRERARIDQLDPLYAIVESDPALALTKRTYRAELATAFRAALATIETRERTLLRLVFVEGAGTEQLAAMYGVHRTTMFRWLQGARSHLLEHVRERLANVIATDELSSLIRDIATSLDVTW
ncbi:MAG: sigma-70 family RNA polymerase sigma factor [Kofleriaceae bacterium]